MKERRLGDNLCLGSKSRKRKNRANLRGHFAYLVGHAGFEPATP